MANHIKILAPKYTGTCQCCLQTSSNLKNMFHVFIFENKELTYSEMFKFCFSIKVYCSNSEDALYLICNKCIAKLKDCYLFRKQIVKAQRTFQLNNKIIQAHNTVENRVNNQRCQPVDNEIDFDSFDFLDDPGAFQQNIINNSKISTKLPLETDEKILKAEKDLEIEFWPCVGKNEFHNDLNSDKHQILNLEESLPIKPINKNIKSIKNKSTNHQKKKMTLPYNLDPQGLTCKICNLSFTRHIQLLTHMAVHFPNHICHLCGKLFVLKHSLTNHISSSHSSERFPCSICSTLLKKENLKRHMLKHSGGGYVYKCPSCPEKFVSYCTRITHMRVVHKIYKYIHKCHICPKKFELRNQLAIHIQRTHTKEKKVICDICGASFFDKTSLKNHMVRHSPDKEFTCDICLKTYARRKTLIEHLHIHDVVKRHGCTVCNKRFTQNSSLKSHMKTHHNSNS